MQRVRIKEERMLAGVRTSFARRVEDSTIEKARVSLLYREREKVK